MKNIRFSVSHTTRPKRDSEGEGRDYFFISRKQFKKMIKDRKFLEWAEVHGHYYGTSWKEIRAKRKKGDLILDIDVQGARQVKEKFSEAIFIFVLPPNFQELRRRLKQRSTETSKSLLRRLSVAKEEIKAYPLFDFIIINDRLDQAVLELESIILGFRCLRKTREKELRRILRSFGQGPAHKKNGRGRPRCP
jgi:guanylate kinase